MESSVTTPVSGCGKGSRKDQNLIGFTPAGIGWALALARGISSNIACIGVRPVMPTFNISLFLIELTLNNFPNQCFWHTSFWILCVNSCITFTTKMNGNNCAVCDSNAAFVIYSGVRYIILFWLLTEAMKTLSYIIYKCTTDILI